MNTWLHTSVKRATICVMSAKSSQKQAQNNQKTAIIYARTSSTLQKEMGTIEAQLLTCRKIAKNMDVRVIKEITDAGLSGTMLKNRELKKVIEDLKSGKLKIDYLIVKSQSRIFRENDESEDSMVDVAKIEFALKKANITVIDEKGKVNYADALERGINSIFQNKNRSDLINALIGGKIKCFRDSETTGKAKYPYASVPFGYKKEFINPQQVRAGSYLVPCPINSVRLIKMFEWIIEGGIYFARNKILEEGWEPQGLGVNNSEKSKINWKKWNWETIHRILNDADVYFEGEKAYILNGERYVLKNIPKLLTAEIVQKARIMAAKNTRKSSKHKLSLLSGFMECYFCGHLLTKMHNESRKNYYTPNLHRKLHPNCEFQKWISLPLNELEPFIIRASAARYFQISVMEFESQKNDDENGDALDIKMKAKKADVLAIKEQMDRLIALNLKGILEGEDLERNLSELKTTKNRLLYEIEQMSSEKRSKNKKQLNQMDVAKNARNIAINLMTHGLNPEHFEKTREMIGKLTQNKRIGVWQPEKGIFVARFPAVNGIGELTVKSTDDFLDVFGIRELMKELGVSIPSN